MAKGDGKYGKGGKKGGQSGAARPRKMQTSRTVELTTRPLFDQAEVVKAYAELVLLAHEGSEEEKRRLADFITRMDAVQASIQQACKALDMGGNPMYRSFTIRS